LSWKNDPDNQVESYQLEKSRDGKNFNTIYDVKTNSSGAYSYTDQKPEQGNNFYRLLAFFKSGKKDYSQVLKQSIRNGSFSIDKVFKSSQGVQVGGSLDTASLFSEDSIAWVVLWVNPNKCRASVTGSRFHYLQFQGFLFHGIETKTEEKRLER
jgi:hypothetical protein